MPIISRQNTLYDVAERERGAALDASRRRARRAEARDVHARIDRVSRRYLGRGVEFAGAVPVDPALQAAVRRQRPLAVVAPEAAASRAVDRIAARLVEEHRGAADGAADAAPSGDRGFLQRLAGWIRRDR